jgi:hypothetical protein
MTPRKARQSEIRSTAYAEAAALLEADCNSADLQCAERMSEADEERVREYIRNDIVAMLRKRAGDQA